MAASSCPPSLIAKFGGEVTPRDLTKQKMASVAVRLWGKISNDKGTQPSALRKATFDFDKNGAVDAKGLPVCKRSKLEALGTSAARRICRNSIVGSGMAHFAIEPSEQGPIPIPLTVFKGGATTLFVQSSIPAPAPTPIVATVKLSTAHEGRYGLQAVTAIPPIADGSGSLLDFSLTIKRLFNYKGTKHSYATARCSDGQLAAQISTAFADGAILKGTVIKACTPNA
jgi:hypothetical protein